jgi:hypothetical protein
MTSRDRPCPDPPTVAVIGGGFSGLLTAIHLLQADRGLTVRLVERAPQFGRGRAYGTENPDHLLNVRVANMSAFPDEPDHFAAWLRAQGDCDGPGAFVSRGRAPSGRILNPARTPVPRPNARAQPPGGLRNRAGAAAGEPG